MDQLIPSIWEAARQAGPFASLILLIVWYLERQERLEALRGRDALYERVLTAMSETKEALKGLREIMRGGS